MFITAPILAVALVFGVDEHQPLAPIPVQIHLATELGAQVAGLLYDEVERIFLPAGIRFAWQASNGDSAVRVIIAAKPPYKVITGCSRGLHDHRLGQANPRDRSIVLWTEQVARGAAGDWDSRVPPTVSDPALGRALGRVLAHELGHLFLRGYDHGSKGLMRKSIKHRDLSSPGKHGLRFSSDDLERLRAGARRLVEGQPLP